MQRARARASARVKALLDGAPLHERTLLELRGALLGDSVFETMRAYGGAPFRLDAHLDRLERSAAWARLRRAPRDVLSRECVDVSAAIGDGAVRIFVFRGAGDGPLAARETRRLVFSEPLSLDPDEYARGVAACVLPADRFGTDASEHAKYARYLPRLLARDDARARGFDDALLADPAGRVLEAATASVFAFVDGGLVAASVLASVTRDVVLELAQERGIAFEVRPIERDELDRASEVFLASSLRELVPVARVDDRVIGPPGKLTRTLHASLRRRAGA